MMDLEKKLEERKNAMRNEVSALLTRASNIGVRLGLKYEDAKSVLARKWNDSLVEVLGAIEGGSSPTEVVVGTNCEPVEAPAKTVHEVTNGRRGIHTIAPVPGRNPARNRRISVDMEAPDSGHRWCNYCMVWTQKFRKSASGEDVHVGKLGCHHSVTRERPKNGVTEAVDERTRSK